MAKRKAKKKVTKAEFNVLKHMSSTLECVVRGFEQLKVFSLPDIPASDGMTAQQIQEFDRGVHSTFDSAQQIKAMVQHLELLATLVQRIDDGDASVVVAMNQVQAILRSAAQRSSVPPLKVKDDGPPCNCSAFKSNGDCVHVDCGGPVYCAECDKKLFKCTCEGIED